MLIIGANLLEINKKRRQAIELLLVGVCSSFFVVAIEQVLLIVATKKTSIASAFAIAHRKDTAIMEMQQYVTDLLKNHNRMKQEIEALRYELSRVEAFCAEEMIEAMTYSAPEGERVDSGRMSNKTPDIALSYAQNLAEQKTQMTREITVRLHWLCEAVERLDFYIDKLPAHQAAVLRNYYFDGYSWHDIESFTAVSYKTLVRHKKDALKALTQNYLLLESLGVLDSSNQAPTLLQ